MARPLLILALAGLVAPAFAGETPAATPSSEATPPAPGGTPLVAPAAAPALTLDEVISGVTGRYPPFLAALIERDITEGRTRQARGAFDTGLNVSTSVFNDAYYDGSYGKAILEQPLSFWGGSVYGGYRLSSGFLPNYSKDRTQEDGQFVAGIKLPLLRDGTIDTRRVRLSQALIDEQLADPFILRQRLDFIRAATVAYYNWLAMGHRLLLAEELLRVARERDTAIADMIKHGAAAPIVRVDNERLVLSRRIALVQATRRFEAAAIELSLFHRAQDNSEPIAVGRERLPKSFPAIVPPDEKMLFGDTARAVEARPETRRFALTIEKARLDEKLADNALLPDLSVGVQVNQSADGSRLKDINPTEVQAGVELKIPLERREAKGRLQTAKAQIDRLEQESRFARERIVADVRDSFSALRAASGQIDETLLNVDLARQLLDAEDEKFRHGATDMLALQIREQAAFDARVMDVDSRSEYFRALANYRAATAADTPAGPEAADRKHDFRPKS